MTRKYYTKMTQVSVNNAHFIEKGSAEQVKSELRHTYSFSHDISCHVPFSSYTAQLYDLFAWEWINKNMRKKRKVTWEKKWKWAGSGKMNMEKKVERMWCTYVCLDMYAWWLTVMIMIFPCTPYHVFFAKLVLHEFDLGWVMRCSVFYRFL